ncbi:hypothetical protein VCSRO185_1564 [Vibrio cholerae]|nr:hypothetical protein VCSRO185_1564 [Vibrio cholerae]CAB1255183.1 Uncharacterised protein [Vibrio cholerae]
MKRDELLRVSHRSSFVSLTKLMQINYLLLFLINLFIINVLRLNFCDFSDPLWVVEYEFMGVYVFMDIHLTKSSFYADIDAIQKRM